MICSTIKYVHCTLVWQLNGQTIECMHILSFDKKLVIILYLLFVSCWVWYLKKVFIKQSHCLIMYFNVRTVENLKNRPPDENETCHVMHYLAILLMCRVTLFVSSLFSFLTHRMRSLRQGLAQRVLRMFKFIWLENLKQIPRRKRVFYCNAKLLSILLLCPPLAWAVNKLILLGQRHIIHQFYRLYMLISTI